MNSAENLLNLCADSNITVYWVHIGTILPFGVLFLSREKCSSGGPNFENGFRVWYTNRFKTSKPGVDGPTTKLSKALGASPIIFKV